MDVSGTARSARPAASLLAIGATIAVILGILSMHVINPITGCASQGVAAMVQAHTAPTAGDRILVADSSGGAHSTGATHGSNQCTATVVRKALLYPAGAVPAFAITSVALASVSLLRRRRDRPLVPDPLSIAGGLRR